MAPRFKQLLFQTFTTDGGASAFIGFPVDRFDQMYNFRDMLREEIQGITGNQYRSDIHGPWDDIDVQIRFFDSKDEGTINSFYSKPPPGCLASLLHSGSYAAYKAEEAKIKPLIKIEIFTSHDWPCVVIENRILTVDSIAQIIKKVSGNLNMRIVRSNFSFPMNAILMSNREFDAEDTASTIK
jgi:hypothetical protein